MSLLLLALHPSMPAVYLKEVVVLEGRSERRMGAL